MLQWDVQSIFGGLCQLRVYVRVHAETRLVVARCSRETRALPGHLLVWKRRADILWPSLHRLHAAAGIVNAHNSESLAMRRIQMGRLVRVRQR